MAFWDGLTDRVRNYFVDEDEDDYYEDEVEQPQPQAAPAAQEPVSEAISTQQAAPAPNAQAATSTYRPQQQPIQTQAKPRPVSSSQQQTTATYGNRPTLLSNVAAAQQQSSAPTIAIKDPRAYKDVMDLANTVRRGESVLINFKNMADQQARRSIDFLTGVVFTLDGDIQNVGGQIFLITPAGVVVDGAKELSVLAGQNFENFDLV